jgi:hypothetical protein
MALRSLSDAQDARRRERYPKSGRGGEISQAAPGLLALGHQEQQVGTALVGVRQFGEQMIADADLLLSR